MKSKLAVISIVLNVILVAILCAFCALFGIFDIILENIFVGDYYVNVLTTQHYTERLEDFKQRPNNEDEIIFVGDSITEGSFFDEIFLGDRVINRGIDSDTTDGILNRVDEIVESNPAKIFIMIGINDIGNRIPNDQIINNYQKFINTIKQESPETEIYLQSVLPCNYDVMTDNSRNQSRTAENIENLNSEIKVLAEQNDCTYIDLYSGMLDDKNQLPESYTIDGVHLTHEGYNVWGELLEPYFD